MYRFCVLPAHSNLPLSHRRHVYKWRFKINTSQQQQHVTDFTCFAPVVHSHRQKTERGDGKLHGANVAVFRSINASIEDACFWRCYYTSLQNHTVSVAADVPASEVHASAVLVRLVKKKKLRRLRDIQRHKVHATFCENRSKGSKHGWLKLPHTSTSFRKK